MSQSQPSPFFGDRFRASCRVLSIAALAAGAIPWSGPAHADAPRVELPTPEEVEAALPAGASLTGREIWQRFLANRFRSATAMLHITSVDPGGGAQETLLRVRWKDFRVEGEAVDSVIGKTWVRFEEPFDLRSFSYLGITRRGEPDLHFIYRERDDPTQESPLASRRVRRIRLDGVGILGTDYTFDQIAFHALEDASYRRLPDEEVDGRPVYVVEARLADYMDTRYPTTRAYIGREHYVLIRQVFWDRAGVERRELRANVETLEEFDGGLWMATQSTMYDLKARTRSTLTIESVAANPDLPDRLFTARSLMSHQ